MRTLCLIPGPDPRLCRTCSGEMSLPHFGQHSGLWIRTCKDCGECTYTKQTPEEMQPRSVTGIVQQGELVYESIERPKFVTSARELAKQIVIDARMRQAGESA